MLPLARQVDRVLEKFGMAMGPFRTSDLAGGDVSWFIRKRRYAEHAGSRRQVIADRLCEMGGSGRRPPPAGTGTSRGGATPSPIPWWRS